MNFEEELYSLDLIQRNINLQNENTRLEILNKKLLIESEFLKSEIEDLYLKIKFTENARTNLT